MNNPGQSDSWRDDEEAQALIDAINDWKPEIRNLGNGLVLATCPKCRGQRQLYVAGMGYDCDRCGGVGEVQVR